MDFIYDIQMLKKALLTFSWDISQSLFGGYSEDAVQITVGTSEYGIHIEYKLHMEPEYFDLKALAQVEKRNKDMETRVVYFKVEPDVTTIKVVSKEFDKKQLKKWSEDHRIRLVSLMTYPISLK